MAIENILTPVDVIIAELGKFKVSISKILKGVADKQEELNSIKVAQNARAEGLDVREAEVKKIEDVIKFKDDAQKLLNQTEVATRELLNNQKVFNESVIKQNKEIADKQTENEHNRLKNENETKALIKTREDLETEKANFKLKLAQGLVKQAEKM